MGLGPPPINRLASGLMALLDTKSLGSNPGVLRADVTGTLELNELYVESALTQYQITTVTGTIPIASASAGGILFTNNSLSNALPVNGAGNIAAPMNELWFVKEWTLLVTFQNVAGDTAVVYPSYATAGFPLTVNAFPDFGTSSSPTTSVAGRQISMVRMGARPFIIPPGAGLVAYLSNFACANAPGIQLGLRLARLLV